MKKAVLGLALTAIAALSLTTCNSMGGVPEPSGKAVLLAHSDFPLSNAQEIFLRFDFFDENGKVVFSVVPNTSYTLFKNCEPGKVVLKSYGLFNLSNSSYGWKQNIDVTIELRSNNITIFPLKGVISILSDNYVKAYIDAMKDEDMAECVGYLKKQKNIGGWKILYNGEEL